MYQHFFEASKLMSDFKLLLGIVASLIVAVMGLGYYFLDDGPPSVEELSLVTGRVTNLEESIVQTNRRSSSGSKRISFQVSGHDRKFLYPSWAPDVDHVQRQLQASQTVTVWYETKDNPNYTFTWAINSGNQPVMTYNRIVEAQEGNTVMALILGGVMGLICITLMIMWVARGS